MILAEKYIADDRLAGSTLTTPDLYRTELESF